MNGIIEGSVETVVNACFKAGYRKGRADAIDEVIANCGKEYQTFSQDTICKIWLSTLEELKEQKND